MSKLPRMQRKVYDYLLSYQKQHGTLPDLSALAREFGIHYVSLKQHIVALDKKGYLNFRSRGRGQSPLLSLPPQATGVPILGHIPAGPLSEAISEAEGYLPLRGTQDSFALRVQGDSMADLIMPGDVVLFKKGRPQRSGEICAVRVDQNDVTLKYLDWQGESRLELRPHNPSYPRLVLGADEVHIEGVYQGLLRGDILNALLYDER